MQRVLDILLSGLALILLSPLILPIAIALRMTGEGEVFYAQRRIGRGGEPFSLLKFATMLKNSPNIGTGNITVKGDPRVLPFGGFLRKTKINELPQLINILRGDMSIIGPRPMTEDNFRAYTPETRSAIAKVRPGLSGIGSVIFRNEEEMLHASADARYVHTHVIGPYKGALEQWYVTRQGLSLYVALIVLTAWAVVRPQSRLVWRMYPSLPKPSPELSVLFEAAAG
ncbi:sugar transferase [Glacieibacterium megasporae]|uniref:sugar transferase n=1 Tax=Glacieibacterium megasporae TaxID=2835787 RepID=UPI001C1E7DC2|nr:sugar transferase [Polymorphobacter megasporae]UAJ10454.1 sugar transferase [Polymorphobacter megasporae]